jgi:hypothetical protein
MPVYDCIFMNPVAIAVILILAHFGEPRLRARLQSNSSEFLQ